MMAPPERDAFFYLNTSGPDFDAFIAGYQAAYLHPVHWHTDLLIYYTYRIQLRNLAQWLHDLLHEPLDEGQREHDLKMPGFHCLERFAGVERMAQELPAASLTVQHMSVSALNSMGPGMGMNPKPTKPPGFE